MEMRGSRHIAVTRQHASDASDDPVVLKACVRGCERVESASDNPHAIAMAFKIGSLSAMVVSAAFLLMR